MSQAPYIKKRRSYTLYAINPNFPSGQLCADPECQHTYDRHFDPYEDWAAVGCKYCPCNRFKVFNARGPRKPK
jgi:hypothetical protein